MTSARSSSFQTQTLILIKQYNGLVVLSVKGFFFLFQTTFTHTVQVKEEMLFEALTTRKTVTVGEKLIVPYKLSEVIPPSCSAAEV